MELCTKLQQRVLDLETIKNTQALEISSLKRIVDIDANEDIYLVNVHNDEDIFGVNEFEGDEVIVESVDVIEQAKEVIDDITWAKALMEIKSLKPRLLSDENGNNFVDFKTELLEESLKKAEVEITQEGSLKRAGDELEQERSKKQKVEDDKESGELKKCLEIIPNDKDDVTIDVTIDATPLSSKRIVGIKSLHEVTAIKVRVTAAKLNLVLLRKEIVDIAAQTPSAHTIFPRMFKLHLEPLAPKLLQNMEAHIDYLKYTQEQADILPELLVYVRYTCSNAIYLSVEKVESSKTSDSNTSMLSPIGLKCSTSNYGSKPTSNKLNDKISQTPSRNMDNKVEAQPRNANKKNHVVEPIRNVDVKQSQLNANSELICATCKKSMFEGVHDLCILDFVKNVSSRAISAKKHKKS
nr:hypothetical protein [Tanacetum cinerariifolium]